MKTLARQNLKHTDFKINFNLPKSISLTSVNYLKPGKKYLHIFEIDGVENSIIFLDSVLCDYLVEWEVLKDDYLRFYTLIDGCLQYASNLKDQYCRYRGNYGSFRTSSKSLAIASDLQQPIRIKITPKCKKRLCFNKYIDLIDYEGHQALVPRKEFDELTEKIVNYSLRHSLRQELPFSKQLPETIDFGGYLNYYLNLSTIMTLSDKVDKKYKFSPYSVKLFGFGGIRCKVFYQIKVIAAAGEDANVMVTAIESLSEDTYTELRDLNGEILKRNHRGNLLSGEFELKEGCSDIGLHIYTPYGYGDDTKEDKYRDLAIFEKFEVVYEITKT